MPSIPSSSPRGAQPYAPKRPKAPLESYLDNRPRKPRPKGKGFAAKPRASAEHAGETGGTE